MGKPLGKTTVFLSGNEAIARGAYESGIKVAASYPGTPASEILEHLALFDEVDAQWSVNEKVAFEVALSSSIAGVRSIYASKHVGVNVAMDALMTSAYTGVGAGFVIVSADDPGIHSSQNEQDNRLIAKVAKIPLLEPASPAEAKEFIKEAFKISEKFDTPVMLRLTTRVSHTKENLIIQERKNFPKKNFTIDTAKYVMVPKNAYRKHALLEKKIERLQKYSEKSSLNKIELNDRKIGIITSGVAYLHVKEMYPKASFLKLGFSFPYPQDLIKEFSKSVKQLYVIEELEPFLEDELKRLGVSFKSKHPSFRVGELRPEYIPLIIRGEKKPRELNKTQKPVMCPGCSHRPVFWVLRELQLIVTGDIGCYTLGALPPLSSLHTCLCMGSGVTFLEGFKRNLDNKVVGVIGDSTFVHSGITGLINMAYNKTKGVLIILDNSTTAMTGSQPHPATGITIKGGKTKKLVLEDLCVSCGADTVEVVEPHDIKKLEKLIKKRLDSDTLSVIIARSPCQLIESKKSPPPNYSIEKCKKCDICLQIDCPAIKKDVDGFIEIDKTLCTGCNLCVKVCPFGALKTGIKK
ncbi:MAG: indolepyruvate ferredoxin oxidoreductase subunit alpha [Candidatus Saelkia tenebricola]|nr:indolepyruvate ferredoxin oxidoreductase subunit alpha [Candidatus Saelkia tenebricola]